jgi:hypothetical protein
MSEGESVIEPEETAPGGAPLSRRRLLINSAKAALGTTAILGTGLATEPIPIPVELPKVTEEIAGHWTTF